VQGNVDILDVDIHFELFDETRNRKRGVLHIGFLAVLLNLFFKVFINLGRGHVWPFGVLWR
jgi:hypothetical protein